MNNSTLHPMVRRSCFLLIAALCALSVQAQTEVEYYVDTDPGMGLATKAVVPAGADGDFSFDVSTQGLTPGYHTLGLRAMTTTDGVVRYAPTLMHSFYVPAAQVEQPIVSAEYFIDTDPGFGQATALSITPGVAVSLDAVEVSTDGLSAGYHTIGLRTRTAHGWSPTVLHQFSVTEAPADFRIVAAEYFWNSDPGFGQATPIAVAVGTDVTLTDFEISTHDVSGDATLYLRCLGTKGWGPTMAFEVALEAEGAYTLDAQTATNAQARTYQTLGAIVAEFANRGIGNDISISVATDAATYALDATDATVLGQLQACAEALDGLSVPRAAKRIAFAAEAAGNVLDVTTTADGLPTVVGFFAHTRMDGVELRINGQAYDFSVVADPATVLCSGQSVQVPLDGISTAITATWTAQPHSGTHIQDYAESGTGALAMAVLANNGGNLDSLAYAVTLTDAEGDELYAYTHYIYVHPLLSGRSTSNWWRDPYDGIIIYPGTQRLSWNSQAGVTGGYRLTISRVPVADETAQPEVTTIDTDQTTYDLTAEEGYRYTWTVTAYGHCDELTSTERTLYSRQVHIPAAELAALRQLYADHGGANWNGNVWDVSTDLISLTNWSGVTFDVRGHVTAIDLSHRGLSGHTFSVETLSAFEALTMLNLSYNQIDQLTGVLPESFLRPNLSNQHRAYNAPAETWPGLDEMTTQQISVGANSGLQLTQIMTYDHSAQAFNLHPELYVYSIDRKQIGTLTWSAVTASYTFAGSNNVTVGQDAAVALVSRSGTAEYSAMPATLHFVRGDANLSGLVDVNDVQRTLNYVLNTGTYSAFGLWSANTYADYETEPVINIQDIVCTVDIVLDNESAGAAGVKGQAAAPEAADSPTANLFYTEGRKVLLSSADEVAAFDLELTGVSAAQVRLLLSARDWQMTARNTATGVRVVVFSPTGATLPAGATELLRLGADAIAIRVQATSADAEPVQAAVAHRLPTGIVRPADEADTDVYDLAGRRIAKPQRPGVYVVKGGKRVYKK